MVRVCVALIVSVLAIGCGDGDASLSDEGGSGGAWALEDVGEGNASRSGQGGVDASARGPVDAAERAGADAGQVRLPPNAADAGPTPGNDSGAGEGEPSGQASNLISESCVDGQYTETLPTPEVSIDAEVASYESEAYMEFIFAVLEKRYPLGGHLIENALLDQSLGHCVDFFLSQKNTAQQVIGSMSLLVHECGHFLDMSLGGFFDDAYVINESLTITCQGGSTPGNGGGKTFARSLITSDAYSDLWPPCASFGSGGECDSYAPVYLDGDPSDGEFDSGDQGFGSVLEEVVQYINSLATGYAFNDYYSGSVSERDGILTFLWYMQRYLRLARLEHPAAYDHLAQDSCWREAILTAWGRAWIFLSATEGYSQLGLRDDFLETLVLDADLYAEIERLRELQGCPAD
mgnify:CR=1 FL=1